MMAQHWVQLRTHVGLVCLSAVCALGCGGNPPPRGALRINEVMSANDGANIDEVGQTDDWIELRNDSDEDIWLDDFLIGDSQGEFFELPRMSLEPGERVVLWADDDESQGPLHLPFKLSASGDSVVVRHVDGDSSDHVELPAMVDNDSYARIPESGNALVVCRYATPGRDNGTHCGPTPPPDLIDNITFQDFTWPATPPFAPTRVSINEVALKPAAFIELTNVSDDDIALADLMLRIATHKPGQTWPDATAGVEVMLGDQMLERDTHAAFVVSASQVAALMADPLFEGVVTLFQRSDGSVLDRVDFMSWPTDAVLARQPNATGHHAFCATSTPSAANDACDPLQSRPLADRDRHFYTPGDFGALAAGGTDVGINGVKLVIDRQAGNVVHLLSTAGFDLHYTFVREQIEHLVHLDRCVPQQDAVFRQGWSAFSRANYDDNDGQRRFYLATLDRYASGGQQTMHFTWGDKIAQSNPDTIAVFSPLLVEAYFTAMAHVADPEQWFLHPQSQDQAVAMHAIDGQLPLLGQNAPYRGQVEQPLTRAVGFGVLTFIAVSELEHAALGPEVIVVTDDVPNDIGLVGGLITETFQTPLAHVNLLSRNRNTPNLALKDAREHPVLKPLFDKLVRLEVTSEGFSAREASSEEAQAFWESRRPRGPKQMPALNTNLRGVQMLANHNLESLPAIGAKAAQLAELARVVATGACSGNVPTPANAFAVTLVHSIEHMQDSGAKQIFMDEQDALADPTRRGEVLDRMRAAILAHPVDPTLLALVHANVSQHFGTARVRLRSSSNTEDLPEFNGAGLYTSVSAAIDDPELTIADGMRTVWSSLWSRRAYDERELANVDQSRVAIAILVHEAFPSERANGVAISRNILDPLRGDAFYYNFQVGEAAVTNPAPGVTTEQVIHTPWARGSSTVPELSYLARSSLTDQTVFSIDEVRNVTCVLQSIHNHFRGRLDPQGDNAWFAMDIELKLLGADRELMVKQARPYSFGSAEVPAGCREFP